MRHRRGVDLAEDVQRLVRRQAGLVTRGQLGVAGVPLSTVHGRLRRGRWQWLLPGVYATWQGPVSREMAIRAALLWARPLAALTGVTALACYGAAYLPELRLIHLVIPQSRQLTTPRTVAGYRLRVTRSDRWPPVLPAPGGFPCMPAARAVGDAVRGWRDPRQVRAVALGAVQNLLVRLEDLEDECEAGPQRGSALLRMAVADALAGVRSSPEAEFRDLALTSRVLPEIVFNHPIRDERGVVIAYGDAVIPEVKLVVEIDSAEHHSDTQAWQRTLERHNRLSALGYTVLHVTPARLRSRPAETLREVEQTYLLLRASRRSA